MKAASMKPAAASQKILFVIRAGEFGGLEVVLMDWLASIDYAAASVVVACSGDGPFPRKVSENGLPVECVRLPSPDRGPWWKMFPKWVALFTSIRPDRIFVLEGAAPDFNLALFFAARFASKGNLFVFESTAPDLVERKKPRLHYGFLPGLGLWWHKAQWNIRMRGRLARQTFTASQGTKDKLAAYYNYPVQKTTVLYHGVDTKRFCPSAEARAEFRRANGIPQDAIVILSHGRIARNKRVERIVRAFEKLSAEHPNRWLVLTAHGPLRAEVERLASGIAARDRVKFIEFQGDVSRLVQAGDIYVLSSRAEGFGIALVEAMACGLVCVATRVSGPTEIISDGDNGLLGEESEAGVFEGMRRALGMSVEEAARMRQRARITAVERFDLPDAVQRALQALRIPRRAAAAAGAPTDGASTKEQHPVSV